MPSVRSKPELVPGQCLQHVVWGCRAWGGGQLGGRRLACALSRAVKGFNFANLHRASLLDPAGPCRTPLPRDIAPERFWQALMIHPCDVIRFSCAL